MNQYFVYILTNRTGTLYLGLTNNLKRRIAQHKAKLIPGFSATYNLYILIYFETFSDVYSAIAREKQLKKWRRQKKLNLIKSQNPNLTDLAAGWFD